jgi:phytanoyl-CoA hydroxylase
MISIRKYSGLSRDQINSWNDVGVLVLENLFSKREMKIARKGLDDMWESRRQVNNQLVIDVNLNGSAKRKMFRDADDSERENVYKLNDAFLSYPTIRDLALADRLTKVLSELAEGEVCICNSLHFERGSQQALHVDTFYMPPPANGRLIVASICLEDVTVDAGPLNYVRNSHCIPPFLNSDGGRNVRSPQEQEQANWYYQSAIRDRGLPEETFLGRAGDVIVWHEQLVHGGSPILDLSKTRKSLVIHYWRAAEMEPASLLPHRGGFYMNRPHPTV